jgi:hypothetical protein
MANKKGFQQQAKRTKRKAGQQIGWARPPEQLIRRQRANVPGKY